MSKKNLALAALAAGLAAAVVNLLVEWLLNGRLVSADYITSAALFLLTPPVIFILFRKRSR